MMSPQCITGAGWTVLEPQTMDADAGSKCGSCWHPPHQDGPCVTCRTEARLQRLERAANLPIPGDRDYIG